MGSEDRLITVLKLLSDEKRYRVLKFLAAHGPLSLSDLARLLGMDTYTEMSKLRYHMRKLESEGLVIHDTKVNKYHLTKFGKELVKCLEELQSKLLEGEREIRGVHVMDIASVEMLDWHYLYELLRRELSLPRKMAKELAKAVELKIHSLGLKVVPLSLVREVISATLLEQGLTEYSSLLGKLGPPASILRRVLRRLKSMGSIKLVLQKISEYTIKELLLTKLFPRTTSLHYVRGEVLIEALSRWLLNDLLFVHNPFIMYNSTIRFVTSSCMGTIHCKDGESTLSALSYLIGLFSELYPLGQVLPHFSTFLAMLRASRDSVKRFLQEVLLKDYTGDHVVTIHLDYGIPPILSRYLEKYFSYYIPTAEEINEYWRLILNELSELFNKFTSLHVVVSLSLWCDLRDEDFALLTKTIASGVPIVLMRGSKENVCFTGSLFPLDINDEVPTYLGSVVSTSIIVNTPLALHLGADEAKILSTLRKWIQDTTPLIKIKEKHSRSLSSIVEIVRESTCLKYTSVPTRYHLLSFVGLPEVALSLLGVRKLDDIDLHSYYDLLTRFIAGIQESVKEFNSIVQNERVKVMWCLRTTSCASKVLSSVKKSKILPQAVPSATYLGLVPLYLPISLRERLELVRRLCSFGDVMYIQLGSSARDFIAELVHEVVSSGSCTALIPLMDLTKCMYCCCSSIGLYDSCRFCLSYMGVVKVGRVISRYLFLDDVPAVVREEYLKRVRYQCFSS